MNYTNLYPIAFFAYNRPEHTFKSLESLTKNKLAKKSKIYFFIDGPKSKKDVNNNNRVLKVIDSFKNKFSEFKIIRHKRNLGLAENIVKGIDHVLKYNEAIIVLEDDIEVSHVFLKFINDALTRYKNTPKVWHIAGYTKPFLYEGNKSRFFWEFMTCWGWGTWRNRWVKYYKDPKFYIENFNSSMIKKFDFYGHEDEWNQIILNKYKKLNTWAVFWHATIFLNKGFCLNPVKSLSRNIGFDDSGINCGENNSYIKEKFNNNIDNIYPKYIEEDLEIINSIRNSYPKKSLLLKKIIFYIRNFFPLGKNILNFLRIIIQYFLNQIS